MYIYICMQGVAPKGQASLHCIELCAIMPGEREREGWLCTKENLKALERIYQHIQRRVIININDLNKLYYIISCYA